MFDPICRRGLTRPCQSTCSSRLLDRTFPLDNTLSNTYLAPMIATPQAAASRDEDALLLACLEGQTPLIRLARSIGATIDQLLDWLESEPVRRRMRRLAEAEDQRTAFAARAEATAALRAIISSKDSRPTEVCRAAIALLRVKPLLPPPKSADAPPPPLDHVTDEECRAFLEQDGRLPDPEPRSRPHHSDPREPPQVSPQACPRAP